MLPRAHRCDRQSQSSPGRGHEGSRLGHQTNERSLPQVGRFTSHVRPGQNHQLAGRSIEGDVIRDERAAAAAFDDRMSPIADRQLVTLVHLRLDVIGDSGRLRQPGQHVEGGNRPRRFLDSYGFGGDPEAKLFEQLDLPLQDTLIGTQNLFFVLLERWRDEPLASGYGLFAMVVRWNGVQIRLRDLDVVAKYPVVTNFQRIDARAPALMLLELGNHLPAGAADAA